LLLIAELSAHSQTSPTLCAKASVQLSQNATLDRQAFIATMTISNGLPAQMTDVGVVVNFTDANGNPVTDSINNPGLSNSLFFIRLNDNSSIPSSIDSSGSATISWLIIPTLSGAGTSAVGTTYNVGAVLSYKVSGEPNTITVTPAPILVEPLPSLALDYFLPMEVDGDNPSTPQVEPSVPFSFGMRVRNTGVGAAANFQINSGQPQITANVQGLAVKFALLGSEVNGAAQASPTFLVNFGNIPGNGGIGVARWIMTSSLSGQFTGFNASFTHADALGGSLTSLITGITTHLFIHDVLIDTPGADNIRDFLGSDATHPCMVFGSDGVDTPVQDVSASAALTLQSGGTGNHVYKFTVPAASGFLYASKTDLEGGNMALQSVVRADGRLMNPNNVWLSSAFNKTTNVWNYFFNVFDDTNHSGLSYTATYSPIVGKPTLAPIADQTIHFGGADLNLTIKATNPGGSIPALSVTGLPTGPTFTDNHTGTGVLHWGNSAVPVGQYTLTFTATANGQSDTKSAVFTVTNKSGLQTWKDKYAALYPGLDLSNQANPMHDGLTNLVKYALNLDPGQAEANSGVVIGEVLVNGKHYLTLTYTHRTDDPALSFVVVAAGTSNAPDTQWAAQTQTIPVDQTLVPSGMETDEIQDSVAIEDGPVRRFLKLRVNITGN
jgi:hypothetical protein